MMILISDDPFIYIGRIVSFNLMIGWFIIIKIGDFKMSDMNILEDKLTASRVLSAFGRYPRGGKQPQLLLSMFRAVVL